MEKMNKFLDKCKNVHGNKYDYSLVNYINNKTKVVITCPTHGEFEQTPDKLARLRPESVHLQQQNHMLEYLWVIEVLRGFLFLA